MHFHCAQPSPGALSQVQPVTGSVDLDQIFILFITGPDHVLLILPVGAILPGAVAPQPTGPFFFELGLAQTADPLHLGGVNVADHCTVFGAGVADQEATLSAVVSAFGGAEIAEAAHALERSLIGDPGVGEGGGTSGAAGLWQGRLALLDANHPGLLLIVRLSRHEKRLLWSADQELMLQVFTFLHVLHLDVL